MAWFLIGQNLKLSTLIGLEVKLNVSPQPINIMKHCHLLVYTLNNFILFYFLSLKASLSSSLKQMNFVSYMTMLRIFFGIRNLKNKNKLLS